MSTYTYPTSELCIAIIKKMGETIEGAIYDNYPPHRRNREG
jgi:hypothetical protein